MAKTFPFRITAEGFDKLRRELESLGPAGTRVFEGLKQAAPGFADGMTRAAQEVDKARKKIEQDADKTFVKLSRLTESYAQDFATRVGPLGSFLSALGPAGLAAGAGLGAVAVGLTKAAQAAEAAERANRKVEAVLKATGNAAGLTAEQIDALAGRMQDATLFDDKQVKEAAARLLTFKGVSGEVFERVIRDAGDLATVFDGDLNSAVVRLGRALEDPVAGMDDLEKTGVRLSDSQKELIRNFSGAGEKLEALKVILGAVEERVGGAAANEQQGLTGAMNNLGDAWDGFLTMAGNRVRTDAIAAGVNHIAKAVKQFNELMDKEYTRNNQENPNRKLEIEDELRSVRSTIAAGGKAPGGNVYLGLLGFDNTVQYDMVELKKAEERLLNEYKQYIGLNPRAGGGKARARGKALSEGAAAEDTLESVLAAMFNDQFDGTGGSGAGAGGGSGGGIDRHADAVKRASAALDDLLERLAAEYDLIGATSAERKAHNDLLALEKMLKDGLIKADDTRIVQARTLIGEIQNQSRVEAQLTKI